MKRLNRFICILLVLSMVCAMFSGCGKKEEQYDRGFSFNYGNPSASYYSSNWTYGSNAGSVDTSVAKNARAKYTKIKGNGKDTVTILVYMCGTDLESNGGMATYDLQEMAAADLGENVNVIVFTGGCKKWKISQISTRYNQIYEVLGGNRLNCLVENAGTGSMVDPATLTSFIEYGVKNFPANRYELIMWDHGVGTIGGYGHDEKYPNAGTMDLAEIDEALTDADVKFDFIGFDACLMANIETAMMLTEHADYLIASEESEPGIGWYYTNWLNALSKNTSMPTVEIGKNIVDSFVSKCTSDTPRQPATLSVVDLAEVQATVGPKLSAFSKSASDLINNGQYKTMVAARQGSREFGSSNKVDLVDLVDLAKKTGSKEANELAETLLSCIKYNNTSKTMTNAYGLSVYFPYQSTKYVNTVLKTYDRIGFNQDYAKCIRSFAGYSGSGQVVSGGTHNPQQSVDSYQGSSSQQSSSDVIFDILQSFISDGSSSEPEQVNPYSILLGYGLNLLLGSVFDRSMADYISENHFDVDLNWKGDKIEVSEKQWSMITDLRLNMLIDDGKGYIDLGNDFIFDTDKKGNLIKLKDMTWLAASVDKNNWQVVPFYFLSGTEDGDNTIITGRIPVLLNGNYADLMVYMDDMTIEVVGATYSYNGETPAVAKSVTELKEGDTIEFVCDYYDYDGNFVNNYVLGDTLTVGTELFLGDVDISTFNYLASYQITDIYGQVYWTVPMNK